MPIENRLPRLRGWVLPASLVVVLGAIAIVPRVFVPAASLVAGLVLAIPAVAIAAWAGARLTVSSARVLAACATAVTVLAVSAALSANVSVSLAGTIEARTGWAMWAVGVVWLWVGVVLGSRCGLKRIAVTVALIGVVLSGAAVGDALGIVRNAVGWSIKPAGLFENALSLGQFLVLALGCALAWTVVALQRWEKPVAWASVAACVAGIALSGSRGAWLGAAAGLLFVVAVSADSRLPSMLRRGAGIVLGLGVVAGIGSMVLAAFSLQQPLVASVDRLSTGRLTLWHAALLDFADSPLLGTGPGMYSSFASWGQSSQGALSVQWANDPHSVVLYWLIGGGVIGFVAFAVATVMMLRRLVVVSRRSLALSALVLGAVGWSASTLFTWTHPYSLLAVSVVIGALLGAYDEASSEPDAPAWTRPVAAVLAAALIAVAGAAVLPGIPDEFRWAGMRDSGQGGTVAFAQEVVQRSADPGYAVWLLTNGLPRAAAQRQLDTAAAVNIATQVLGNFEPDIGWYAPLALASIEAKFRARSAGLASVDELERAVVQARAADRGSGCFDFVAADRFAQLGLERRALAHARTALGYPLSPEIRARLERYVRPDTIPP